MADEADSKATAIRAVVHGAVQGVGFRDATVRRARQLQVMGWVRNGEGGTVLVHAEGPEPAVEQLREFLAEGPAAARVAELTLERVKVEGHEQFGIRGFERVTLAPGASTRVSFTVDRSDFGFYDNRGEFVVEPGRIDLYAGSSSSATLRRSFTVTGR